MEGGGGRVGGGHEECTSVIRGRVLVALHGCQRAVLHMGTKLAFSRLKSLAFDGAPSVHRLKTTKSLDELVWVIVTFSSAGHRHLLQPYLLTYCSQRSWARSYDGTEITQYPLSRTLASRDSSPIHH